ncbi:twin-arginine translocase subunit TatC [Cohnella silvisoli]|uniref:Sec-independent protein translocase protein TatC n=1 Tax=Cohnella silvisoli TaxID=2873699 RepID=A0ABV1KMK4_9BACL|nr:twin-arginine translocase subunit TatC [Cohnella silvisoli]MCD9020627.1 twin-arginine translocase subunit TatC [Cohnella silvisoli]
MKEIKEATLLNHMRELRRRLLWIVIALFVSVVGGMFVTKPVILFIKSEPLIHDLALNVFSPSDAIGIWLKIGFIIGFTAALPFTMYQLWLFVRPGLHPNERRAAIRYIPYATLMFATGLVFAYYIVFPMAFTFTSGITKELGFQETYGISQYFSFLINIVFPVSLLFELPILIMFLTRLKLISPKLLGKFRKFAYLLLIIVATVITPPDLISDILVAIPLLLLFELSVLLSKIVYRKSARSEQKDEVPIVSY